MEYSQSEITARYYQRYFVDQLSNSVSLAEQFRQNMDHQKVDEIFNKDANIPKVSQTLANLDKRIDAGDQSLVDIENSLRAGYAGHGRIKHVDVNSQLLSAPTSSWPELLDSIDTVQKLYQVVDLPTLLPFSIHGGSINWLAETTQDMVTTYERTDRRDDARRLLAEVIGKTKISMAESKVGVDLETDDELLKAEDYAAWKQRKIYIGSLSGLAVLYTRQGKINKSVDDTLRGLEWMLQANSLEPNPHRLATLSLWTLEAGLSSKFQGHYGTRVVAEYIGMTGIVKSLLSNAQDTRSAIKQYYKQNLPRFTFMSTMALA